MIMRLVKDHVITEKLIKPGSIVKWADTKVESQ